MSCSKFSFLMLDGYNELVSYTPPTPGEIRHMRVSDAVSAMMPLARARKYCEDRVYHHKCVLQCDSYPPHLPDLPNIRELERVETPLAMVEIFLMLRGQSGPAGIQ
jgi:hypothetical protein